MARTASTAVRFRDRCIIRGCGDRTLDQDYELRYWSEKLGVSQERLKQAVEKVGVMADDVARELGKQR